MNKIILLGRLTKKPEIRYSQANNTKIAMFSLAVDRKYTKPGEERETDFFNILAYSKLAEFAEKHLNQGQKIIVCGRVQNRTWTDKNGITRYTTEVIAEEMYFADSQKKTDENNSDTNQPSNIEPIPTDDGTITGNDDDLPF